MTGRPSGATGRGSDGWPASPTARFSGRVAHYVQARPGYPPAVIDVLRRETGLTPAAVIADVGCGTGLSAEPFLENGNAVIGVEPNGEMRASAAARLAADPRFRVVEGTAEATTLPAASVHYVVAGQAFHWFDPERARAEFVRILVPGGCTVLLWNTRRTDGSPFLRAYEALLAAHGTDYQRVRHDRIGAEHLGRFFRGPYRRELAANAQDLDLAGLRARLLSSSYVPGPGEPGHGRMLRDLERSFHEHEVEGRVRLEYDTEIYFGRLR